MIRIFILILCFPLLVHSQVKKNKIKTEEEVSKPIDKGDGFLITGYVQGFPDGTPVSFLNQQTGAAEQQAVIQKGKFIIKGKMDEPGFKGLIFNNAQPLVPLFLDNSNIKITGNKDALDKLSITGSPAHTEYSVYSSAIKPYEKIFSAEAEYDSIASKKSG